MILKAIRMDHFWKLTLTLICLDVKLEAAHCLVGNRGIVRVDLIKFREKSQLTLHYNARF